MDILDHPEAQALLQDAELSPAAVRSCADRLAACVGRYLPLCHRAAQRDHARTVLEGQLTALPRKTTAPIATQAGPKRRPLQRFVGAGGWQDRPVLDELCQHVDQELGDPEGVFVLDPSGFPNKGADSCGVARQWCGRLGKVENCQVGVFLAYASRRGKALLDARLYLDQDWAADAKRRAKTPGPADVTFPEQWRLGLELLDRARGRLAGSWVAGDDQCGRCTELRAARRRRRRRYVLDVPCNTLVRDLGERRPPKRSGGKPRRPAFARIAVWAARQPGGRWRAVPVRDGEKGPLTVRVLVAAVQTKDEEGRVGPSERLVVLRGRGAQPPPWYALSNAREAKRWEVARAHAARHRIEELLEEGKGAVGLGHSEVRRWVGWHHHMTLSLLALGFLQRQRLRLGGKNPGRDGAAGAGGVHGAAEGAGAEPGADRGAGQPSAAA